MKKLIVFIIIPFLLTGCFNYRELNDLAIVSAIAIDYKNDAFNITVQVVNPKKQQDVSSANEPEFIVYESNAKTLQEAFRYIIDTSPNKIYGSHLQVLVISEEVATNHMNQILDFFSREPEARTEFYVMIARNNTAKEELSITTPLINLSSTNIMTLLETNNQNLGVAQTLTFNELLNSYLNPYIEISLPSIEVIGNDNKGEKKENLEETDTSAKIKLSTTGVFKDNKLLGFLNEKDSMGLNILLNNTKSAMISYQCKDNEYIVSDINSIKNSMEADLKDKKVSIKLSGHSILSEINCDLNIKDNKVIDKIEKEINEELKQIIKNSINTIQKHYKTDVLKIRDLFYKTDPKYFKEHFNNWDKVFEEIEFDIKVDLKLYEKGNTLGGIVYEKKQY